MRVTRRYVEGLALTAGFSLCGRSGNYLLKPVRMPDGIGERLDIWRCWTLQDVVSVLRRYNEGDTL